MTTYQVTSDRNEHQLIASWPDLPERANHPVAVFKELKLATVAKSVLNAASRYRWHRWVQLQDQGVFTDERAGRDPTERPATATAPTRLRADFRSATVVAEVADERGPRRCADRAITSRRESRH